MKGTSLSVFLLTGSIFLDGFNYVPIRHLRNDFPQNNLSWKYTTLSVIIISSVKFLISIYYENLKMTTKLYYNIATLLML